MPKEYSTLPSVNRALKATREYVFRGNTNGQHGAFGNLTDEDVELANQFDTKKELARAIAARRQAGLD